MMYIVPVGFVALLTPVVSVREEMYIPVLVSKTLALYTGIA